jgi:uncharacterized damage-inducible protein DinB
MLNQLQLLSRYNRWMNEKLYATAAKLDDNDLTRDQGAYFKSILGTLNHIMVADLVWLNRFAAHPAEYLALDYVRRLDKPSLLNQILYKDFYELNVQREQLDQVIIDWCLELIADDLDTPLFYHSMKKEPYTKKLGSLILHFFNHQTHHRGQATTLLSQNGLDVGITDLLLLIPDENQT